MTEQMTTTAEEAPPTLVQKLAAEAIGTAVLVILGCGAVVVGGGDIVSTGFAFGIAIVAMAYAFGRLTGGHFNPAVSVGAALSGRLSWKDTGLYSAAQVAGAVLGGIVLAIILLASDVGWELGDPMGSNGFGDQGGVELFGALLIEIVLTFIFLLVILSVTDERNDTAAFAPLVIGLSLAAIHFVAIPATGTSVNPARSIGVAFESGGDAIAQLWLFIVAPLIGGAVAGLLYPMLFGRGSVPVAGSGFPAGGATATVPGLGAPDAFQQQWNQQLGDQQPVAQQAGYAAPVSAEQPIIQDGWQWDPTTQQWIPAQQQPPVPQADQPGGWAPPPGTAEHTQVRPPDA